MENSRRTSLVVNLTGLGDRPTGAGAYAQFCARVAQERFDAAIISTPAWIERLPGWSVSAVRYAASALASSRAGGVVYNPTYRTVPGRCGQIVTILDLLPVRFPRTKPLMTRYFTRILPEVLARGRGVIVLSETMRREVSDYYCIPPERIHVVPPGVDTDVYCPAAISAAQQPYLLSVGTALPHKNLDELLDNAALWTAKWRLVIAGALPSCATGLVRQARRRGIENRVLVCSYVEARQLIALYQGCSALVYPSLNEGFGMPPLEALACGRPVIVSDIPVHREVCGDAALYVTPGDRGSWQRAFESLDNATAIRACLDTGREKVRRYSWDNTRQRLCEVLQTIIA